MSPPPKPQEHGTIREYRRGCRCDACRSALRNYSREYRARKRAGGPSLAVLAEHGSTDMYQRKGCRCELCTERWERYKAERRVRRGSAHSIPLSSPFRALASTCPACGTLRTTPDHLIRRDTGHLPQCKTCKLQIWRKRVARARDRGETEFFNSVKESKRRHRHAEQRETLEGAARRGQVWTSAELEFLTTSKQSIADIAQALSRTAYAVKEMRRRISRGDPKLARLAGLDTPEARLAEPETINISPRYGDQSLSP